MPAIRVKSAAKEAVRAHPREFALLTQLGSADGAIDQQVQSVKTAVQDMHAVSSRHVFTLPPLHRCLKRPHQLMVMQLPLTT